MKMSHLFSQTLRDAPTEAEVISHSLLMRAGFIRPLGAGIFSYLHLAKRSMMKIEAILRDKMDKIGGQEISMPVIHPASVWKETGRWYQIGSEMGRFKDRNDHDMVLAMTHEEVVADLVRREIQSYKQLPRLVYHIQTKWRDDPRPRAGLIRVREFTMKDSYSLDADWDGLDKQYRAHYQAYFNIYHRCGLPVIAVKSDVGMMGGKLAHEFMYLTPIGEDTLLLCAACGYTANRQVARFKKPVAQEEAPKPVEKVATPDCKSIEDLANFLGGPKSKTAKAVFLMASIPEGEELTEKFIFAILRGDMELNETKLANAVGARDLRPATDEEIRAMGAVPGYASPVGLVVGSLGGSVVVDDIIPASPNLVAGANDEGYHLLNVNYGRDYTADIVADIAAADEDAACPECGAPLKASRGVEVGNIFQLGTRYSDALGCTFLDKDGQQKPVIMGSYGIGVGRLLACAAEEHHDDHGLAWPITIAPFHVHLVLLRGKGTPQAEETADKLYVELQAAGIEVLYDDRDESPGVKFNDADLIGCPIRITVSARALSAGGVEVKLRHKADKVIVPLDETVSGLRSEIAALEAEISAKVLPVDYNSTEN
ncbi:MAG: proline--tRNA ligase [Anaerolineales bacterium]|nr:proline--tRNA ligase [Anaerolineales bacterium]